MLAVDADQLAGPLRWLTEREHGIWRRQARALPGQVARLTGAPVAQASHVGPITGETPMGPGIPWPTEMIGESQICDRDGTILARMTLEDGEGHASADVQISPPAPLEPIGERFWIPSFTMVTHAAWYGMNAHGALKYKLRHARKGFEWQRWPAGDLPDEIGPRSAADTPHATTS